MKVWCMNSMDWEEHECYLGENGLVYQRMKNQPLVPSRAETHFPIFDERIINLINQLKKEKQNA